MALPKMMQDVWDNHLDSLTPMMKMYLETKKQHDDCIIFYRLGDFYEMFLMMLQLLLRKWKLH